MDEICIIRCVLVLIIINPFIDYPSIILYKAIFALLLLPITHLLCDCNLYLIYYQQCYLYFSLCLTMHLYILSLYQHFLLLIGNSYVV